MMRVHLRRYLVAGLLVWLPIGATIVVFSFLLNLMDRLLLLLPAAYRPEALLGFRIPGLGAILAAIVLLATAWGDIYMAVNGFIAVIDAAQHGQDLTRARLEGDQSGVLQRDIR